MKQTAIQMLNEIDERMSKLQQMRALIIEEYGDNKNGNHSERKRSRTARREMGREPAPELLGRKFQIHEWLKEHGPATRSQIIDGTGLPVGTVSGYLSAEKNLFRNRDGNWYAR